MDNLWDVAEEEHKKLNQNNSTKRSLESFLRLYKLPENFNWRKLRGEVLYRTQSNYNARLENTKTARTKVIEINPDLAVLGLVSSINLAIEELR